MCFHVTLNTSGKGKLLGHTLHPEAAGACCKVLLPVTLPLPTHVITPKLKGLLCPLADSSSEEWLSSVSLSTPQIHVVSADFYCNNLLLWANIVQICLYGSLLSSTVLGPLLHSQSPKSNHMGPKTVPSLHSLVSWVTPLPRDVHVLQTKPAIVFLELENESKSR